MIKRSGLIPIVEIIEWSEMVGLESRGPRWHLERSVRRFFWARRREQNGGCCIIHITARPSHPEDIQWCSVWLLGRKAEVPRLSYLFPAVKLCKRRASDINGILFFWLKHSNVNK